MAAGPPTCPTTCLPPLPPPPPRPVPAGNYVIAAEGSEPESLQPCLAVKFATDNAFPILGSKTLDGVLVTVDNAEGAIRFKRMERCNHVLDHSGSAA